MNKIRCIITICLAAMTMAASAQTATSNHNFEVAKNLDIFNALYRDLDLYYVDTLDAAKNIDNAANYMLEMLDPYTEYYAEDNSADLRQLTTGKYVGIGALTTFRPDLKRCIVAQPFAGMPADQVGILPGDIIMAIDGKQLDPCTSADKKAQTDYANSVTNQLRGEPGTTFELKVRRPTTGRTYTYKITRRNITRPSVTLAAMVADSVGYIRLSQFIDGTSNEIRRALVDLKQRGARRLVLDLRNNPGGLLDQAVSVSDAFLNKGVIVSMRGRQEETAREFVAKPQDTDIIDTPLVVLVNGGSASASEIVAGALGDQKRALLVGERTFGKGSVQNIIPLSDGSGLKLTVALYYTPSGRSIQAEGIMPDLEVPFEAPKEKPAPLSSLRMIREKDLNKHLEKTDGDKGKASGKKMETPAPAANEPLPDAKEFLERDNQLRMSLQFVKSLPKIRTIH